MDSILDKVELVKRVFSRTSKLVLDLVSLFLASELVRRITRDRSNVLGDGGSGGVTTTVTNNVITNGVISDSGVVYGSNVNNPAIYGYYPNVAPMVSGNEDVGSYYFNVYYRADSMYDFIVLILGMVMIFVIVLRLINLFTRGKSGRSRRNKR